MTTFLFFVFCFLLTSQVDCFRFVMVAVNAFISVWQSLPSFSNQKNNQPSMSTCLIWMPDDVFLFPLPFDAAGWLFSIFDGCHLCFQTKKQSTFDIDMPSFWMPVDESILLARSKLAISSSKFAVAAINSSVPVPPSRTTLLLAPTSDSWLYHRTCGIVIGRTDSRFPWISQLSIPLSGTA